MLGIGKWLHSQHSQMTERRRAAMATLKELEKQKITREILREQWNLQVAEQTKPSKSMNVLIFLIGH